MTGSLLADNLNFKVINGLVIWCLCREFSQFVIKLNFFNCIKCLPYRIGLCGFENPMRDAKTVEVKRQIGQVRKIHHS